MLLGTPAIRFITGCSRCTFRIFLLVWSFHGLVFFSMKISYLSYHCKFVLILKTRLKLVLKIYIHIYLIGWKLHSELTKIKPSKYLNPYLHKNNALSGLYTSSVTLFCRLINMTFTWKKNQSSVFCFVTQNVSWYIADIGMHVSGCQVFVHSVKILRYCDD